MAQNDYNCQEWKRGFTAGCKSLDIDIIYQEVEREAKIRGLDFKKYCEGLAKDTRDPFVRGFKTAMADMFPWEQTQW